MRLERYLGYTKKSDAMVIFKKEFPILLESIRRKLNTEFIGKKIYAFGQLGSTNDFAKKLAQEGEGEGTLILADQQTKGRGRFGRGWESPPGQGLWFSIILRPNISPEKVGLNSLLAGVSIAQAVERISKLRLKLKWPNDLLIHSKKFCGVLIESEIENNNQIAYLILGVGINVGQTKTDFSKEIRAHATSLAIESKEHIDRIDLLVEILHIFEKNYLTFKKGKFSFIFREWTKRCPYFKKKILIKQNGKIWEGIFENLDEGGRLLLRLSNGEIKPIHVGETLEEN